MALSMSFSYLIYTMSVKDGFALTNRKLSRSSRVLRSQRYCPHKCQIILVQDDDWRSRIQQQLIIGRQQPQRGPRRGERESEAGSQGHDASFSMAAHECAGPALSLTASTALSSTARHATTPPTAGPLWGPPRWHGTGAQQSAHVIQPTSDLHI